jgi:hypothetical protein
MASFDMGRAWNEAQAVLTHHWPLIGGLVLAGTAVAAIVQYGVFGFSEAAMTAQITAMSTSGGTPDPMALLTMFGSIFAAILAGSLFSSAATVAATRLVLAGPAESNIVSALIYGLLVSIVVLAFTFAVAFGFALVFGVIFGLLAAIGGGVVGGILAAIAIFASIPLMLWLLARLILMTTAMAAARSVNPLYGLAQSWMRTGPVQWPLVGYLVLLIIAAIVISLLFGFVGMAFTALIGGSTGEALAAIISGAPITILSVAVTIGIWRVLSPDQSADVFA